MGESAATRKLGLKGADFQPQEYLIRIQDDTIVLMGRDWEDTEANRKEVGCDIPMSIARLEAARSTTMTPSGARTTSAGVIELPGAFDDQGTCYATYDFLERFCDVRWYGPAPINVVVPSQQDADGAAHGDPPFALADASQRLRRRHLADSPWPVGQPVRITPATVSTGGCGSAASGGRPTIRSRASGPVSWRKTARHPEQWERSRPDFFAVGWENEGDWRQLCLTNPDLVQQVVQDARDFFDGKPAKAGRWPAGDYFAIVPQDSDHWCKCDRCQAILAPGQRAGQTRLTSNRERRATTSSASSTP